MSIVIRVPVLPTPALKENHHLGLKYLTSTQFSTVVELKFRFQGFDSSAVVMYKQYIMYI